MNRSSPAQIKRAKQLLAHESAISNDGACAAGQVFEKIHAHLDSLVGAAGVQALLVRSAQLTRSEFAFLEGTVVDSSTNLRECLQGQEPSLAGAAAAALFGAFFTLITSYIGERLTTQALRAAWPTIEEIAPTESTHE